MIIAAVSVNLFFMNTSPRRAVSIAAILLSMSVQAQSKKIKESPASVQSQPIIVLNSVVTEQWPATLPIVNLPADLPILNPGQCVRVGIISTGVGFEHYLDGLTISYSVVSGDRHDAFPMQPAASSKLIKPEGGDFVTGALASAGVKNPFESTGSLAVSGSQWCVPLDAAEGTIKFKVVVKLNGQSPQIKDHIVHIESIQTAAAKSFMNQSELGPWMTSYHQQPEPGRLLAAVRLVATDHDENPNGLEFLKAAFGHDAGTSRGFGPSIAKMDKLSEMVALTLLKQAGVSLDHPPALQPADNDFLTNAAKLPDPYDMKPGSKLWMNLDLLWSDFTATGRKEPIVAITRSLAWKADYNAFATMQKEGKKPASLTNSLIRGLTYSAAGWSLSSFDRNDPLAADYIQAIRADPATDP
ncbi:MAG TPA: hypothetical protein VGU23_10020, partial [Acidobacteriaceae bacterium]|nr:hypothetical protein [Acidobacteriaceae bacterium]